MSLSLAPASGAASSNLATALLILPRTRRRDALVFYRFCRAVDDIADSPTLSPTEKESRLAEWREALTSGNGLPQELAAVMARHRIEAALPLAIIEGCASDVRHRPFPHLEALSRYCWNVAGAVGLASIRIFGCRNPSSQDFAVRLGRALQLTNILRDAGEDAARGRVYFPLDMLANSGCEMSELLEGRPGPGFLRAARSLAAEARADFQSACPPADDLQALLPALVMAAIYRRLLEIMERDGFRVFDRRYQVSMALKALLALRVIFSTKRASPLRPDHHRR